MQAVPVKSTSTHYFVEIERTALGQGPTVLKEDDKPVAVLLPIDDYQAFQQWQAQQQDAASPVPSEFARRSRRL